MNTRRIFLALAVGLLACAVIMPGLFGSAVEAVQSNLINAPRSGGVRPPEKDVRGGAHGVPKSSAPRALSAPQAQNLRALQAEVGAGSLVVQYNDLTSTPRHLFSRTGYLTAPATGDPEIIARGFLKRWQGLFRFSDADLASLKIKSQAFIPDMGTNVLVLEQQIQGVPVYKGEVLVNINRAGRVLSVGSDSFPQLKITNAVAITPAAAIEYAARDMGLTGYSGQSLGATRVLAAYGKAKPRFITGQKFSGGNLFSDEIVVTRTIFPLGAEARHAYKFTLTTPQFAGITWENVVDAQTGEVLHRFSLTMFQGRVKTAKGKESTRSPLDGFGPPGGGPLDSRRATFRPDVQDLVEGFNAAGTAQAKIFDAAPGGLSGRRGFGRPVTRGARPGYLPESPTPASIARNSGRGFREALVRARVENAFSVLGGTLFPFIYNTPFGQIPRGMPDALNPSAASPFGWYYLPTNPGGTEITQDDTNRASTQNYGYTMADEAKRRNVPENSPVPCTGTVPTRDCDQPFSATLTMLPAPVVLADGRTLSQVFQSNYTEGNNVLVSDDRANDDEVTNGIRGYAANRQFTDTRFDFTNSYEFGGQDPVEVGPGGGDCLPLVGPCDVTFPATADPDIFPGTLSLFYYNNLVHDYIYNLGFTEATFNMQQDNFGKGGAGRDGVIAQVQDGSGTDNANMSPTAEGAHPRMQMYLFTEGGFRRADGSLDFDVVAHEHMHAINNRAVGKGDTGCVGNGLVGESGGQGEGWGDYLACSMADDDVEGEYATGEYDIGIRRIPYTNYRWSYEALNGNTLPRRDRAYNPAAIPDLNPGSIPFEVHDGGELWAPILWDMRELLIVKQEVSPGSFPGVFFDGTRRLGSGTNFYIGNRLVQSKDTHHPIDYRPEFNTHVQGLDPTIPPDPNIIAAEHIVRPGLVATEIQSSGNRNGPLATALRRGAFLADVLMMRGMQLSPCNPTFVDSRDSILLADRERFGGENHALIWRAFASHGVGALATSSSNGGAGGSVVEDFSVPAGVTTCEQLGPLAAPAFALTNTIDNTATITISPLAGAARFIISRADNAAGPYVTIADVAADAINPTVYQDNDGGQGLIFNKTYFYQVRAARDAEMNCVSTALTQSIKITVGIVVKPAPLFTGVNEVFDPQACNLLVVGWGPATSLNPTASIVYDVYRSETATDPGPTTANPGAPADAPLEPSFEPTAANKIATTSSLTYTDTNLKLDRVYYYIVQARDTDSGKIDTNNTGNRKAKFNAPTSPAVTSTPTFAFEDFEEGGAGQDDSNARFTPPLVDAGNDPKGEIANFQRVTGVQVSTGSEQGVVTSMMYGPDFNPGDAANNCGSEGGGASDFYTTVGPPQGLTLTPTSIMEFDHFFITEAAFDGGVLEIKVGAPFAQGDATPYPNNVNTFDLGNFIVQGGYNGRLNGTLEGPAIGSPLQGRRAYTGAKTLLEHVRIPLEAFAPGGMHNPSGLPVYIRFRMTSDALSIPACNAGWFVDNLVINNLDPTSCPTIGALGVGDLIISEFRFRGASGANDEFVELYNRTEAPIIVSAFDGSAGFTLATPGAGGVLTVLATIPSGAVIPPRGHYLIANNSPGGYSLSNYGGTGKAAPDLTYTTDIPDGSGVALFRTSTPVNFTLDNRLDAAGFSVAPSLYREGLGIGGYPTSDGEYSHLRYLTTGFPQDTNANENDFLFVGTEGEFIYGLNSDASILGAPGPENRASQIQRNAVVKASLVDPGCAGGGAPGSACARVRTGQGAGTNAAFGTLRLRRKFTNKTNDFIRQLRFRVVNITTLGNRVNGEADLRVLSSPDITVKDSNNNDVLIEGLTLEENPPAQANGGGLNSTLRARLGTQIAPNNFIYVEFRLGVMIDGNFRFLINVEALP